MVLNTLSFSYLISFIGAFELVQNFQKIGSVGGPASSGGASSTGSITQLVSDRYNDILEQYSRELDSIKDLFNTHKHRPLLYKNFPPIAGAIAWARDLYLRAKRPIIRFKKHGGLLERVYGESVKSKYLEFARAVDNYINDLYTDWETNIAVYGVDKLRQPVLRSIAAYELPTQQNIAVGGTGLATTSKVDKDFNTSTTIFLPPPPYRTNFPHELKMIIKESRYLDKLGFQIPEGALNLTLQENKYQEYVSIDINQFSLYALI